MEGLRKVDFCFTTHAVGQGLFYSGRIGDFVFVYDCGSESTEEHLNREINNLEIPENKIDLLIISHFHRDHINGITRLLARVEKVDHVVMPYLSLEERLLVLAEYAINNDLDDLDDDYIFQVINFENILQEKAGEITYLFNENDGEQISESEKNSKEGWNGNEFEITQIYPNYVSENSKIKSRSQKSYFISAGWQFSFFCRVSEVGFGEIQQEFRRENIDLSEGRILDTIKQRLKDIKVIYYNLFEGGNGQNATSVVLHHFPAYSLRTRRIIMIKWISYNYKPEGDNFPRRTIYGFTTPQDDPRHYFGHLLTGDVSLRKTDLARVFFEGLSEVVYFQVPHHGAAGNWKRIFFDLMPYCKIWLISFGLGNRHEHPKQIVVDDLIDKQKQNKYSCFVECNQTVGFSIRGVVIFT